MKLWRQSLGHSRAFGDAAATATGLLSIGAGLYRMAQFDSAAVYLEQAEALAIRIGDKRAAGNAVGVLASVRKDQGDLDLAAKLYRRASSIRLQSGDTRGIAADDNNLGLIAQQRGDLAEARAWFERALQINRRDARVAAVALNLGNLAGVSTANGDYARAESLYVQALALHRKSGDRAEAAFVEHGLGKLYMSRGDYQHAKQVLRNALRAHDSSGATMEAVAVRVDLAAVLSATGDPEGAEKLLREASKGERAMPASQASLALARGDLAIQFGSFADAEAEYSDAIRLYRLGSDTSGMAQALEGKALLLHWRGDDVSSLSQLRESVRLQIRKGDRRSASLTGLVIADVQAAGGNFAESRRTLAGVQSVLHALGDAVGEAATLAALGDLALRQGSIAAADSTYRLGLRRLGRRDAWEARWRLHTGLAKALRSHGALAEASAELRIAIASTEKTAAGMRLEERRSGFLASRWSAYTDLALIEQARGRDPEAFAVNEQMRARQMLDLLARGRVGREMTLSAREQDLRRRIAVLAERLESGHLLDPHEGGAREPLLDAHAANATRRLLDEAQKEYVRVMLRLRQNDPAYASLVSGKTRSWKDVASHLKADEIFLEYMLADSACTVFIVTRDTVAAIDLHTSRQALADLVEFSRDAIENRPRPAGQKEIWGVSLRRLYRTLVQPVADKGYLRRKRTLIIAPHGDLHFLSFASLILPGTRNVFLVDRFEIAYTPSGTVWVQLGERRFPSLPNGVLALAPNVNRLPASRREALAIRRIYGASARVRIGAGATRSALRDALPNVSIVHLATFGVLNKHNPLFSFIELAPAGDDDGRVAVNEVFGLPLAGQLVVLSACQTALASGALADVPAGDDWVGLVTAFLQAGAGSVVASLWPVQDRATGELMEEFHRRLVTGMSPVTALAQAQRELIRNRATALPLYWAGFTINGRSE